MDDDPLAALRARFRGRGGDAAARIRAHLAGDGDPDLERLVHELAGSAGMFGYLELGKAAAAADAAFAAGDTPDSDLLADMARWLEQLASLEEGRER